jgi:hypothetical protein
LVSDKESRDQKFDDKVSDLIEIERNFADTIELEIKVNSSLNEGIFSETTLE